MKRLRLLIAFTCLAAGLFPQFSINEIQVNEENPMVSRVVFYCSGKPDWKIHSDADRQFLTVAFAKGTGTEPPVKRWETAKFVKTINITLKDKKQVFTINLDKPYRLETLLLDTPYRLVLDIFVQKQQMNYQERFQVAVFYDETGRWFKAGNIYSTLTRDYPEQKDVYYWWGKLLTKQRNFTKAIEKLSRVPESSSYYKESQVRLAKLQGKDTLAEKIAQEPLGNAPGKEKLPATGYPQKSLPETVFSEGSEFDDMAHIDTIIVAGETPAPPDAKDAACLISCLLKLIYVPWWFWIIILLILVIFVLIIIDLGRHRSERREKEKEAENPPDSFSMVKLQMVQKLSADGWNVEEIARELRMRETDVKEYLKLGSKSTSMEEKKDENPE